MLVIADFVEDRFIRNEYLPLLENILKHLKTTDIIIYHEAVKIIIRSALGRATIDD